MLDNLPIVPVLALAFVGGVIQAVWQDHELPPSMRYWVLVIAALTIIVFVGAYLFAPDTLPEILLVSKEDLIPVLTNWLDKINPGGA